MELPQTTTGRVPKRRHRGLKLIGWTAVAVLACFIVAVAAGLVSDDIKEPKRRPPPPPEAERLRNGWGEPEDFVGQYRVSFLKPVGATRSSGYAEFVGQKFARGRLTLFMREVFEHRPHVPGGVLTLEGETNNLIVYLSELSSNGRVLYATVRGGTYEGPQIGSFGGVKRGNRIFGGLQIRGLPNVEANFYRYSKNPDPTSGSGGPEEVLP